jgi:hypothetical protein
LPLWANVLVTNDAIRLKATTTLNLLFMCV